MDIRVVEEILCGLNPDGIFQRYAFCKNGERLILLGESKNSYVYEMYDKTDATKRFALKVIGLKNQIVQTDRFWQRVSLQQSVESCTDNVVKIIAGEEIELSVESGEYLLQCILMEKLEHVVKRSPSGHMTYARKDLENKSERITLIKHISQAVYALHEEGILHRDIKLENIFYDAREKRYKLGDFGVSRYTETGSADTIAYTEGYGAPEIERRCGESYDDTADIYSLGITMYLLFNGLKFPGSGGYYANPAQYSEDFIFPALEEGDSAWIKLIRNMCSYHMEMRCQSMGEVLTEIYRITDTKNAPPVVIHKAPVSGSTLLFKEEIEGTKRDRTKDRYKKKGIFNAILYYYKEKSGWLGALLTILFMLY
jgi:serine/threonine protein kinase